LSLARAAFALAALAAGACTSGEPTTRSAVGAAAPPAQSAVSAVAATKNPFQRRTTRGEVAVRQLDAAVASAERRAAARPEDVTAQADLIGLLCERVARLGRIGEIDRIVAAGERVVAKAPNDAEALLVRARARATVHRFHDALSDLDRAEALGLSPGRTRAMRASIALGLGDYDRGFELAHAERLASAGTNELGMEAIALGHRQRQHEAEELFDRAAARYRGVSPFVVAWLEFERGAMWDRAGDALLAERWYRAAVTRLPQYAHAVGHLAHLATRVEGEKLLRSIVESSDDPEHRGALALVLADEAQSQAEARALRADTEAAYERLLAKHPLAFADHAGWFFLEVTSDAERALEVAELNVAARPTPEARTLFVTALTRAGETDEACDAADDALAKRYPTPGLKRAAASAFKACGRDFEAAELERELGESARHGHAH
jgi:hypothetical protein